MIGNILKKVFGSKNDRELKKLQPIVDSINSIEVDHQKMSDAQLKDQTALFRNRLENGESLDDVLIEAFATVRETSVRTLKMRHFDCQLIGGIVLHHGKIAEMRTGEGKTLAATLSAYLNALSKKGVHIVTVNDYLAVRDNEWMGKIYNFLGLSVSSVVHGLDDEERKKAYEADITYGSNNEFGFDYLRDNMKFYREEIVQKELNFAIVDEVDSILIDEARTPLIISGAAEKSTQLYYEVNKIIPDLKQNIDYTIDDETKTSVLTEDGVAKAERFTRVENLYDSKNIELLHHINQSLKAHTLFKRDVDYLVQNGEVVIVDEFTGRLAPGRRYSEGLHQALEAKENVKIENENQTLATITFQNYFRIYDKLSGMTGTADTEATEFKKIYDLDVIVIPTNKPMIRHDYSDVIYKTKREKDRAVIEEIKELHKEGQPALVGTTSVEVSEGLSKELKKRGISHNVLNAKNHEKEAEIIAMAGQRGAVTISTNMAGRGTDIVLGEGVNELGGLHIVGTERHESRRIDNQLRGRSGRQGDNGSSRFYLSLEDDLLRIFGGERIKVVMDRLGIEEDEPIEHNVITRAIENAQRKVEGRNFDIRKQIIEYDDVMNQQREVIYKQRRQILTGSSLRSEIESMIFDISNKITAAFVDEKILPEDWNFKGLDEAVFSQFNFRLQLDNNKLESINKDTLTQLIIDLAFEKYNEKEAMLGKEKLRELECFVMLQNVDSFWKDHLLSIDHLKEGIGLRGYAQQNPLLIYKKEGFKMFSDMINRIHEETIRLLFRVQFTQVGVIDEIVHPKKQNLIFSREDENNEVKKRPVKRKKEKIGRNLPCPCGSGKKYKKCCGK